MPGTTLKFKKSYTLVEILAAMGVFMIICVVVMRFFSGAQKITTSTANYNEMYSDVRAFFDLFGSDLKTVVYNNKIGPQGIYPFAHSYYAYPTSNTGPFGTYYPHIKNLYDDDLVPETMKNELSYDQRKYSPLLCFIANQINLPSDARLPLCEIRYTFTPAGGKASFQYKKIDPADTDKRYVTESETYRGGAILRSCTYADMYKTSDNSGADKPKRDPHDFAAFPIEDENDTPVTAAETGTLKLRVPSVFKDTSSRQYHEVIRYVYRLNISCLKVDEDGKIKKLRMFDVNNTTSEDTPTDNGIKEFTGDPAAYLEWPPPLPDPPTSPPGYTDLTQIKLPQLGHPLPDMVRVDLYMLTKKDWNDLMANYNSGSFLNKAAAKKLLALKLRKFSRNFYINKVDVSEL